MKGITNNLSFIWIILCMSALSGIAADMYIAAFPSMSSYYSVPSSAIKWTVSLFFLGLALSQLFYGPISDYVGRKKIMIIGFNIFFVGCLMCLLSGNKFIILLCGRLIQGIGAGATTCISRAMLRDKFSGQELSKAISAVGMGLALVPALAPMVGGYIQSLSGWKLEFAAMLFFSSGLFVLANYFLPETNVYKFEIKKSFKNIIVDYKATLIDPIFLINICIASFYISVIYVFYIMSSFYLQTQLHWSEIKYSKVSIIIAIFLFCGRKINSILTSLINSYQIILLGNTLAFAAGIIMLSCSAFNFSVYISLLLPIALYALSAGIVFSNTFVGATEKYSKSIGLVSSLYGFTQMVIVSAFISLSTLMKINTINGMGTLLFLTSVISILLIVYMMLMVSNENVINTDMIKEGL